ncbi:MAG: hypothetical protein K9H64_22875 [Bacteroidales bacterium]|nr:hypothetical protein [Bacteroidales bacterium]MCF8458927.1 hypothetical protein [Bacteroidales bacterium]
MTSKVTANQIEILWPDETRTVCNTLFPNKGGRNFKFFDTGNSNFIGHHYLLIALFSLMLNMDAIASYGTSIIGDNFSPTSFLSTDLGRPAIPTSDTIVFYDTVYTFDTVYMYKTVFDTVYFFDTIYVEGAGMMPSRYIDSLPQRTTRFFNWEGIDRTKGQQLEPTKNEWSLEGFVSPFSSTYNFSSDDISKKDLQNARKNSFTPETGYSAGININYHLSKNFYVQSGLAFSLFNEKLGFYSEKTEIDTIFTPVYEWNTYPEVDTIWFLNVDSFVVTGEPYWEPYYDTTFYNKLDTFYIENYLPRTKTNKRNETQRWNYFEIPILASYRYCWGTFNLGTKAGLITGLLYKHQRFEVYSDDGMFNSTPQEKKELEQVSLALYISAVAEYQLAEHWSVLLEPWLRAPINQFTKSENVSLKIRSQGLRLGIRYYF